MKILNLTQHLATPEQRLAGVIDLDEVNRAELLDLLTFEAIPTPEDISVQAHRIAQLASDVADQYSDIDPTFECASALIGGAPYLMPHLEVALAHQGFAALYTFSERESVETQNPDGSVTKRNVFRHKGFIPGMFDPFERPNPHEVTPW